MRVVVAMLALGCGSKQSPTADDRLPEVQRLIGDADYPDLAASRDKLREVLDADPTSAVALAYAVELAGLSALLYGLPPGDADRAYDASSSIQPGQPGARERLIGKAALELSRLHAIEQPERVLAELEKTLDGILAANPKDDLARWLHGRALLAAGARERGAAELAAARSLALARIDLGDLAVDEGRNAEAVKMFDQIALPRHTLVVLGHAFANAELDFDAALEDIKVKLPRPDLPPAIAAYRALALATTDLAIEDYVDAIATLDKLSAERRLPGETRFWAHAAWTYFQLGRGGARGDLRSAITARKKCRWYGPKPSPDPVVQLVDAELYLAAGNPDRALELVAKLDGTRARLVRIQALLEPVPSPERAKLAGELADELLKTRPDDAAAQVAREQARMIASKADRGRAIDALEKLARKLKSQRGWTALGAGYFAIGDLANAKEVLARAVKQTTDDSPNPHAYRTHVLLAEIALAGNDLVGAGGEVDQALEDNPGYAPALVLQARVLLRNREPARSLAVLVPLRSQGALTPQAKLVVAEALATRKQPADSAQAKTLLVELAGTPGIDPAELARIAALIDPALPKQLGVSGKAKP